MTRAKGRAAARKLKAGMNGHPASGAGQIVLAFQGGGALGAYEAGVYKALHEAGIEPDWSIGTSIGAINASLIAGNEAWDRLPALEELLATHGEHVLLACSDWLVASRAVAI